MTDLAQFAQLAGVPVRALVVARHRGMTPEKLTPALACWFGEFHRHQVNPAAAAGVLDEIAMGLEPTGLLVATGRDAEPRRCRWVRCTKEEAAGRGAQGARLRVVSLPEVAAAVEARLAGGPGGSTPTPPRARRSRRRA